METKRSAAAEGEEEARWTFLTNHAHVFICIAAEPTARVRDIALKVGITERAVQRILRDLELSGYVNIDKDGRRNAYRVRPGLPFRHPIESHQRVGVLLELLGIVERP